MTARASKKKTTTTKTAKRKTGSKSTKKASAKAVSRTPAEEPPVIFFTGFTGFIGGKLVERLAQEEPQAQFLLLVREASRPRASKKLAGLRKRFPKARFELIPGVLTSRHLGLSPTEYRRIKNSVTDVFHLAAIYDLAVPESQAWTTNVLGTARIIDFCYDALPLHRFVYYSTAYVAGQRTGTVLEKELDQGQGFKNHYEATKCYAEKLVRAAMPEVPTIIMRPGIVVGDSRTGETAKFDGPYFAMLLMANLTVHLAGQKISLPFMPLIGESQAEVNIVPVDYVVNATVAIWQQEDQCHKTYHLTDPCPLKANELFALNAQKIMGAKILGKIPDVLVSSLLSVRQVRRLLGLPKEVVAYFNHDVHFDASEAQRALQNTGIKCPRVPDYFDNLLNWFYEHRTERDLYWTPY